MQPMTGFLLAVLAVATIVAVVCGILWKYHHNQNIIKPAMSRLLLHSICYYYNLIPSSPDVTISFVMTTTQTSDCCLCVYIYSDNTPLRVSLNSEPETPQPPNINNWTTEEEILILTF